MVGAGVMPLAHATDGGGSIRIPAGADGLIGLTPSRCVFSWPESQSARCHAAMLPTRLRAHLF